MFEEKDLFGMEGLDLGSNGAFGDVSLFEEEGTLNAFAEETNSPKGGTKQEEKAEISKTDNPPEENKAEANEIINEPKEDTKEKVDSQADLFETVVAAADDIQADKDRASLIEKLPVFSYGGAEEEIADPTVTFEKLREEKAEDFPELDDKIKVSWKMNYGSISKTVTSPGKTTISEMKSKIEKSEEFMKMLKKNKGKAECKVMPSVTAHKKGIVNGGYKGFFNTFEEAVKSGKHISYVPSDDGRVYEIRSNNIGTFIAPANKVSLSGKIRAGFIPALPKIPFYILAQILTFFKSEATENGKYEAMAYIYWSFLDSKYYAYVPRQTVTKITIDAKEPELDEKMYPLVMEIHSHHSMESVFSPTDNNDEKKTRLYTVVGKLNKFFPDITTRISVGGKFVEINPKLVFESINEMYPEKWNSAVEITKNPFIKGDFN